MSLASMDEEAFSLIYKLSLSAALPMAVKSAIDLNLIQLIKNSAPEPASASQLAARLPVNDLERASNMIDRILWFLAGHSIVTCHVSNGVERRYSLPPVVAEYLTAEGDGVSLAPLFFISQHKVILEAWNHVRDAVLEGGVPFDRAHGLNLFEYPATDPIFNTVLNQAMHGNSIVYMKKIMEEYKGFEGVKSLVDVGGGTGGSLKIILSKYPSIKAINFDLPHVIRHAPSHPGVKHISGDMFVSVPKADAIFMKFMCHDWDDARCNKLLKNCYESLPPEGKVILAEYILPEKPDGGYASFMDMQTLMHSPGGKERTEMEFRAMAQQAGFKKLDKVCSALGMVIMELHK